MGLFPVLTRERLKQGELPFKDYVLFVLLALIGNIVGYGCSAFLDTILYAEPFTKVFTQLTIIASANTVLIAVVGYFILKSVAKRKKQSRNLSEA